MRAWLIGMVVVGAAVAATLTELALLRLAEPPDDTAAVLGALWVTMPYLTAGGMILLVRRSTAALVVLLISLLVAGGGGVSLFQTAADKQEDARRQAETAVLPGEDPDHGPGGMRKASADMGVALGGAFSIALAVVLPPVQVLVVTIPAIVGLVLSARFGRRNERKPNVASAHPAPPPV